MLERAEVDRRGGCRVDDRRGGVGDGPVEVRHREQRVRGRLDPNEVGTFGRRAGLVELDELEAPAFQHAHEDGGAVVGVVGDGDRVPRLEQRQQQGGRGSGSGGEQEGMTAFEVAQRTFGLGACRVAVALVVELARLAVLVGPDRRAVERRRHAAIIADEVGSGRWRQPTNGPPPRSRRRTSSSGSRSSVRKRRAPQTLKRWSGSGKRGSSSHASGSSACSTPAPSSSWIATCATGTPTSTCWSGGRTG